MNALCVQGLSIQDVIHQVSRTDTRAEVCLRSAFVSALQRITSRTRYISCIIVLLCLCILTLFRPDNVGVVMSSFSTGGPMLLAFYRMQLFKVFLQTERSSSVAAIEWERGIVHYTVEEKLSS